MLRKLLRRLMGGQRERREADHAASGKSAHVEGKDAPRHHHGRRAVKDWHTNHWDMDFMSREELEALARRQRKHDSDQDVD